MPEESTANVCVSHAADYSRDLEVPAQDFTNRRRRCRRFASARVRTAFAELLKGGISNLGVGTWDLRLGTWDLGLGTLRLVVGRAQSRFFRSIATPSRTIVMSFFKALTSIFKLPTSALSMLTSVFSTLTSFSMPSRRAHLFLKRSHACGEQSSRHHAHVMRMPCRRRR